ncbi:RPA-interacting protein A [Citrus sinensis]|nr:RPA-interacting protein A [Citrus sinensis]
MADNHQPEAVPNRPSLKPSSHFNNYPLWKAKDFIKSAFQDIVSDELKKFKNLPLKPNDCMEVSSPTAEPNDILWEYDGLHSTYQGECEEILLEMQRIFYEDLRAEPTRKEPEIPVETWEDQEDEYLANAVYEHMHLNDQTWCPICKRGELQENCQLIYCTGCELQLSKDDEINVVTLRNRLADVHTEHLDRGCRLKPKFRLETSFGLTALYIFCQGCSTFEVVI